MTTDGEHSDVTQGTHQTPAIRSARLRGLVRHAWLNDGLEQFPLATKIHWATSVERANVLRAKLNLAALKLEDDPASDLAAAAEAESQPESLPKPATADVYPSLPSRPPRTLQPLIALPQFDTFQWTGPGRMLIFALAATSIGCMLVNNEGLVTTRSFFYAVLLPACAIISAIAYVNRRGGDGRLARAIISGALAGLAGAVVLNLFRLPFVYSVQLGLARIGIPHLPFFNLYPRIGAILLGQPVKQSSYEMLAYGLGWGYHIIRTMTTGVMFAMAIGEINAEANAGTIRHAFNFGAVARGVILTVTIQSLLLLSPFGKLFSIELTFRLILIILLAHVAFGIALSLLYAKPFIRELAFFKVAAF